VANILDELSLLEETRDAMHGEFRDPLFSQDLRRRSSGARYRPRPGESGIARQTAARTIHAVTGTRSR
jgi:hypothetical protein